MSAADSRTSTGVEEAKIDAMLVELRSQEAPAPRSNLVLTNAVVAFLVVTGVYIVIRAAMLFAESRTTSASAAMLAAMLSFIVLLTGLGFMAGAVMLFRKYHQ
jgi:hypothetical protein